MIKINGLIFGNDREKCKAEIMNVLESWKGTKRFIKFRKQKNKDAYQYKIEIK